MLTMALADHKIKALQMIKNWGVVYFSNMLGSILTAAISGYMYGYRDALLTLNNNCSCNYVTHLWEHLDMGDIASLIAPRPL